MGEQDYGQQPLIITHTEPTKESPPTAPTKEMAGCKISKAADPVARGIRNQRSRVPVTPEQRTARNKKTNERKRENEVKIARQRNLDPAPSPDPFLCGIQARLCLYLICKFTGRFLPI